MICPCPSITVDVHYFVCGGGVICAVYVIINMHVFQIYEHF